MGYTIINGELVDSAKAVVPVADRGFRYGDGVFETLCLHEGVPYRADAHMERLRAGLSALKITFDCRPLKEHCQKLLRANEMQNGLLRIQVTRGPGGRGYLPDATATPTLVMETMPLPAPPAQPIMLWQSERPRISTRALPAGVKLCQGVNSTLARMEAMEHDCFDALQLGDGGVIAETSSANIFWLKDGTLHTPSLDCGIVGGITRAAIIELAVYPVKEVRAPLDALAQAEAVVITNTAWGALAVSAIGNKRFASDKLAAALTKALAGDIAAYSRQNRSQWA